MGQRQERSEAGITRFSKSQGNNRPGAVSQRASFPGLCKAARCAHISSQAESPRDGEASGTADARVPWRRRVPVSRPSGWACETKHKKMVNVDT